MSSRAFAWPPVFGPEFTFTNPELVRAMQEKGGAQTGANLAALDRWLSVLQTDCAKEKCELSHLRDRHGPVHRVTFPDGFWYQVSLDTGVIEVQTKPGTRAEFAGKKDLLDRHLFGNAKKAGLAPHERLGGGHLNIGLESAFGEDSLLFRNFIVDQANHPELNLGILGGHPGNSPTISQLSPAGRQQFARVISEFDGSGKKDAFFLAREIQRRAYISNPLNWVHGLNHYQNLRLGSVDKSLPPGERRVEIRGIRPQKSMEEFLLQCELYEERLKHLKTKAGPIALDIPELAALTKSEIRERFRKYLAEMGGQRDKFSLLLNEEALAAAPAPKGCESAFSRLFFPFL